MAAEKAAAVASQVEVGQMIVAADTSVASGLTILGKPRDRAEAEAMLRRLRGREHQVHTGIAVLQAGNSNPETDVCTTDVPMRMYTEAEMQAYIDSGDPFDKAGGYAIQHPGFRPVEHITGCYANVMGLPLCHLKRLLDRTGWPTPEAVPLDCQRSLNYDCTVFETILR
jgi:MAF protein